ncbi:reverse transcriptase [Gossypium australe]|uniref:Reverse transcriptase n=1 Tax=Gossypium australe TaxID=47621 RepID=A0A5B6VPM2_9ROSI|nr:reverse transcriptase [Gossypium australe]
MLVRMEFDARWIKTIMKCISTVLYSVVVNGKISERFRPDKGLPQGTIIPYEVRYERWLVKKGKGEQEWPSNFAFVIF